MAAGVVGKNLSLTLSGGSKSANTVLGGTNIYEKLIISAHKTGPNPGVIHIGGSDVSATIFGYILETGKELEICVSTGVGLGVNLFVFNPSSEAVRVVILGFATA